MSSVNETSRSAGSSYRALVRSRRDVRRAELLDAADKVIRRDGPRAAMDDIAAEAGITKPVLYRHFGDKGGLYQTLAERYVRALMVELRESLQTETDPRARLARTIDTYLSFVEREQRVYDFLRQRAVRERPEAQATVTDFIRQVAAEVTEVVVAEIERFGLDPRAAGPWAHGIVGMVHLAGDWWLEQGTMTRAELVDHLVTPLWEGFAPMVAAAMESQEPVDALRKEAR